MAPTDLSVLPASVVVVILVLGALATFATSLAVVYKLILRPLLDVQIRMVTDIQNGVQRLLDDMAELSTEIRQTTLTVRRVGRN